LEVSSILSEANHHPSRRRSGDVMRTDSVAVRQREEKENYVDEFRF
jgi:hypothetical protein